MKSTMSGFLASAVILVAGPVSAAEFARVLSVEPLVQKVAVQRDECRNEQVAVQTRSGRSYGGTILGGIAGAAIGSVIGQGHGREAAMVIGGITGATIGDNLDNGYRDGRVEYQTVVRCVPTTVWVDTPQSSQYRVRYEYEEREYEAILPYAPGDWLKVDVSVSPSARP